MDYVSCCPSCQVIPIPETAERVILGTVLLFPSEAIWLLFDDLTEANFHHPWHKKIFEAMRQLHTTRTAIDIVNLANVLGSVGLDQCGGVSYICSLTEGYPFTKTVAEAVSELLRPENSGTKRRKGKEMDITRAAELSPEADKTVEDMFTYHEWNSDQVQAGVIVRDALANAFRRIIECVPPCPDRSAALRKLREARMDANSAITHGGKY